MTTMTATASSPTQVPVERISDKSHQIVIREAQRSRLGFQTGLGLLGLGALAGGVASGYLIDLGLHPLLPALTMSSVLSFGMATLLSWRRSGEFEIVEMAEGRLRLLASQVSGFAFDAPLSEAKLQRVKHPMGLRLCLRDGERAVELGNCLAPSQREVLADRIDAALAAAAHKA